MPHGFVEYRIKNDGVSSQTVKLQAITIQQFFSFLNVKYEGNSPQLNKITTKDISDFLDQQKHEYQHEDITVYRKQSNLKIFFDFLWKTNQIQYDIMSKFNYFNDKEKPVFNTHSIENKITYNYQRLLELKKEVFNSDLPHVSKQLMSFYMKGIQLSDMFKLEINDFVLLPNNVYSLSYNSKHGKDALIFFEDKQDIEIIRHSIELARERGTTFLLNVRKSKSGNYEQSAPTLTRYYVERINEFIGFKLRSDEIRVVYVNYLHFEQKKGYQDIADILGRSIINVKKLIAEGLERIVVSGYTKQMELSL